MKSKKILFSMVICLSVISFLMTYGIHILDPTYDDWLLVGGDLSQHYIGWEAFRNSPWKFPFVFNTLTYPENISIMFTDSIPLFALLFKAVSPFLPDTFQYWGIFGLISYILMGIMAALILIKYSKSKLFVLLGCGFFLFSPTVLFRMYGHEALGGGQWIILLALLSIVYYHEKFYKIRSGMILWAAVSFLSCYIHLYFALFCLFFLVGYCIYDYLITKKIVRSVAFVLDYFLVLLVSVFSLGGLGGGDKSADGYGYYSSNLNTFIDSGGNSKFLINLPNYVEAQNEGYAYLGLGMILLLLIVSILTINGNIIIYNRKKLAVLISVAVVSFIYALSNNVTLNDKLLFKIPLPGKIVDLLGIFRCSGRVSWVCFYLLFLFAICALSMYKGKSAVWNRNVKIGILGMCFCIQILDLSGAIKGKYIYYTEEYKYENELSQSESMMEIAEDTEIGHLNIVKSLNGESPYYDIAQFAVTYGKTVNRFVTVHGVGRTEEDLNAIEDIENANEQTAYLLPKLDQTAFLDYSLNTYDAGKYTVGIKRALKNSSAMSREELGMFETWFDPSLGFAVTEGKDDLEKQIRTVYPDGVSYGPYNYMTAGTYYISIEGKGLDQCLFSCHSESGVVEWALEQLNVSDQKAEFYVTFDEPVADAEFVISNIGEENIELNQIVYKIVQYADADIEEAK